MIPTILLAEASVVVPMGRTPRASACGALDHGEPLSQLRFCWSYTKQACVDQSEHAVALQRLTPAMLLQCASAP